MPNLTVSADIDAFMQSANKAAAAASIGALTTTQIAGLSTNAPAALATAPVVGLSMFAARADHAHKTATVYARTKTVGVDAGTIQGCIDLITDAAAQNQAQVLVPPGVYTENLTLKPCVSVVASGQNNGQISTVRIVGNATFTGGATAGDNTLQLIGLTLQTDHANLPALTVTATGGISTLLHMQDCMVTFSNAATTARGVEIGSNCAARLINTRTQANSTAGQGGTHIDVDGGTFYGENYTAEYGTRAILLRGTNGALKPYGELKWSNISVQGSNALEITSNTALLTMGWVNVNNLSTTGSGISIAAGSVVGATQCVFAVQAGASNYVVTGAAGSYYYSLGNSYSNATGATYETKIGASVTQFQYARSYDPASGDLTGTYPAPTLAAITTAQSNVGSGTVIPRLSIDAKGRVTALSTVAMAALTTTQIAGLATTAPSALATAAVVGLSTFAARADHQHIFPTLGQLGAQAALTTSAPLALSLGGTGAITRQDAMDALAGAVTSGQYLRGNGTDVVMSAIQAGDVPTLNQNTTGTAGNVSGIVLEANGGTGESTYSNGQLLIGNAAGGLTKATLTAGSNVTITNGDGAITIASTGGGGGTPADIQVFTSSGTWTKPTGAKSVQIAVIGAGASGGSGRKSASGTAAFGGGAGSGGGFTMRTISADALGATETVTVGAGGIGGLSQTVNSTNGNNGAVGGNSQFGNWAIAQGGLAGTGGTTTAGTGSGATTNQRAQFQAGTGGSGGSGAGSAGGGSAGSAGGGGGGGGFTATPASNQGGSGGAALGSFITGGQAAGGNAAGVPGGNGSSVALNVAIPGGGGGGGYAWTLGNSTAGGNGGSYGGGGGGGGAALDGVGNSGAGGDGAGGIVVVTTYF